MRFLGVRAALALVLVCAAVQSAAADDWWMLKNTDEGRVCGPPLEADDGVVLTPGEILNRFEECKLMDETPSLKLNNVMVNCAGNLNRVFIFSKTKEGCEALAKD
jgi:hypothetical protein